MDLRAGDVDYGVHGIGYTAVRQTDPRIERLVHAALGDARTVVNVGAGTGSYEPADRHVIAIEPSAAMRAMRPRERVPAMRAVAEDLPLDDDSVDAAMAMVTVHQWDDLDRGLRELRRVSRGPVVILTADGEALPRFWLNEYAPEVIAVERRRYPRIDRLVSVLGGAVEVTPVPLPADCLDGFGEAFYARPEAFLDERVRRAQSAWSFLDAGVEARSVEALRMALESGEWDARHGALRTLPEYVGSVRLVVARP